MFIHLETMCTLHSNLIDELRLRLDTPVTEVFLVQCISPFSVRSQRTFKVIIVIHTNCWRAFVLLASWSSSLAICREKKNCTKRWSHDTNNKNNTQYNCLYLPEPVLHKIIFIRIQCKQWRYINKTTLTLCITAG